ncbi:gamma-interferon-inducible lysosomal thiol reductase-like [Quillaja saponaria]|uniref:Gamma-interferon-inducible lysosomal thiol reductase-like n=1 Tax=Quillaja saponaria TaxID=32244 RepID=A0AAD7PQ97_QUISA|nr:gamma-interferon-inducible lysosomal thiol reductase-like [Quillaja saponaria]
MGSCSISCLLLLLSCFIVSSTTTSDSAINSNSDKVTLELYYESLCPYSANFIVNYLEKIFLDEQLISIVDLKLIPYGNARIGPNNTITCQHGQFECLLNTVEACAIKIWPDLEKHFPFIYCVETLVHERKYPEWESCYGKLNLDPKPISDCYSSGYGKELELQYAAETDDLQPPHKYVPWVVVDGQPLYEDYEDVVSYVCKAYKGASVPQACSIIYLNTVLSGKDKPARSVCDKETIMPTLLDRVRIAITSWMHQAYLAAAV